MSHANYINTDDIDEYYKPSDSLQQLFEKCIIVPFKESMPEQASIYEADINIDYMIGLREIVLGRGSTNFNISSSYRNKEYTPADKVLLYCVIYMPMHLYSSYHLYRTHLMQYRYVIESKNVVFIDFGCGPLTSGIAFWAAVEQLNITYTNITYIGFDISEKMLDMAKRINKCGPDGDHASGKRFIKGWPISEYDDILDRLDRIEMGNHNDTLIIFNFSYLLAEETFKGDIRVLINVLQEAVKKNRSYEIWMVYQNVKGFNRNWDKLKRDLPSINFTAPGYPKIVPVKYKKLMQVGSPDTRDVFYDILGNRQFFKGV